MQIFLDSNVFYGNWFLSSPSFKFLLHFITNDSHKLLISDVVIQEVNNLFIKEYKDKLNSYKKAVKGICHLTQTSKKQCHSFQEDTAYCLKEELGKQIENFEIINCSEVPHKLLVNRAIHTIRPFQANEKGYRDSLIWLSLVNRLKRNHHYDEIAFITKNKSDFFINKNNPPELHKDLSKDLPTNVTKYFCSYNGLEAFIDKHIDKSIHDSAINMEELQTNIDSEVEDPSEWYLNSLPNKQLVENLNDHYFHDEIITDISSSSFKVLEGTEDLEILSTTKISQNEVYVQIMYNLRIVELTFEISYSDLTRLKQSDAYYNITEENETVQITMFPRIYFEGSVTYDLSIEGIDELEPSNIIISSR